MSWRIWFTTLIYFCLRNYLKHLLEKTADILFRARVLLKINLFILHFEVKNKRKKSTHLDFFFTIPIY